MADVTDGTVTTPSRLSYSSISTYAECPQRWLLERGYKVPTSTWFATLAGSAIHEITETRDRLELMGFSPQEQIEFSPTFAAVFDEYVAEAREAGREIKPSGRKLKEIGDTGGPNKKDYDWYMIYGPIYLDRWMRWKEERGWVVMEMPDGQPGIELGFQIEIGGQPVVGFIDRVYQSPLTGVGVFDLKSGTIPSGSLQLKTYDLGLKRGYGVEADWGIFWSPGSGGDTGKMSQAVDLRSWPDGRMDDLYASIMRGITAGVFPPHVSSMCSGCSVRDHCWAVAGTKASELPLVPEVVVRGTGEVPLLSADAQV